MVGNFKPIIDKKDSLVYFDLEEVLDFVYANSLNQIWNEYVTDNQIMVYKGLVSDGKKISKAILITDYAKFEQQYIN